MLLSSRLMAVLKLSSSSLDGLWRPWWRLALRWDAMVLVTNRRAAARGEPCPLRGVYGVKKMLARNCPEEVACLRFLRDLFRIGGILCAVFVCP